MVSISPVPKTPVPLLYFHTDGSTPLPAAPLKVSVQTRDHPGPPGPPGPAACTAAEAAAARGIATTMAARTATAPIRPRVSLTIATTSYRLTTAWPCPLRRPQAELPPNSCHMPDLSYRCSAMKSTAASPARSANERLRDGGRREPRGPRLPRCGRGTLRTALQTSLPDGRRPQSARRGALDAP